MKNIHGSMEWVCKVILKFKKFEQTIVCQDIWPNVGILDVESCSESLYIVWRDLKWLKPNLLPLKGGSPTNMQLSLSNVDKPWFWMLWATTTGLFFNGTHAENFICILKLFLPNYRFLLVACQLLIPNWRSTGIIWYGAPSRYSFSDLFCVCC